MKYENINAEEVENNAVLSQARGLEERAVMMEYEADRFAAMGDINPAYAAQLQTQTEQAAAARKEADVFVKAAKQKKVLTDEELAQLRRDVLTRIIQTVEQQHATAITIRNVRKDAGLPVPDRDNQIEEFEASWEVAARKLKALGKPKAEKRTNAAAEK
jgi:hypothetical protein